MTSIEEAIRSGAVLASVKPLEWRAIEQARCAEDPTMEETGDYEAATPVGEYYSECGFGSDSYVWSLSYNTSFVSDHDDPDAAKAAAQADYEARILSALSPDPTILALIEERDRLKVEREDLAAMAGGGRRSLAAMFKATFAGRGVEISDDEAERAASRAADLILHAAMAGNPREWCLSCGTVSGDGQCHCTEPFAVAGCNRKARNYVSEMASEATAAEARALAAEAKCDALREALADAAEAIEHWGAYASSYLQEKHDWAGDIARARARARARSTKEPT